MRRRSPQPHSKLAYEDPKFMESLVARPLRIMAEYIDPLNRLRRANVSDTIVMFGSARIQSRDQALLHLKEVKRNARGRSTSEWRQKVRAARSLFSMSRYYEEARELSRRLTQWSMTLGDKPRRFVICSGGGPGIMEAANRGAYEAGGPSIGLSIQLPHEQESNRYITPELNFLFHYFFMRKLWFAQMAKALIIFPGGFGTMDELGEMLTLLQTNKLSSHHLILIYGRKYWDKVINWRHMVRTGTINEREFKLLQFADNVDEAFDHIRKDLEAHHLELESDSYTKPTDRM
ncbi:MAG: TIGR00730 family Rossman fold protein [Candidatus Acidiferrales bacterium]